MFPRFWLVITLSVAVTLRAAPAEDIEARVASLLARMTLDEKIGQMTQPDQSYIKDLSDIETLKEDLSINGTGPRMTRN